MCGAIVISATPSRCDVVLPSSSIRRLTGPDSASSPLAGRRRDFRHDITPDRGVVAAQVLDVPRAAPTAPPVAAGARPSSSTVAALRVWPWRTPRRARAGRSGRPRPTPQAAGTVTEQAAEQRRVGHAAGRCRRAARPGCPPSPPWPGRQAARSTRNSSGLVVGHVGDLVQGEREEVGGRVVLDLQAARVDQDDAADPRAALDSAISAAIQPPIELPITVTSGQVKLVEQLGIGSASARMLCSCSGRAVPPNPGGPARAPGSGRRPAARRTRPPTAARLRRAAAGTAARAVLGHARPAPAPAGRAVTCQRVLSSRSPSDALLRES